MVYCIGSQSIEWFAVRSPIRLYYNGAPYIPGHFREQYFFYQVLVMLENKQELEHGELWPQIYKCTGSDYVSKSGSSDKVGEHGQKPSALHNERNSCLEGIFKLGCGFPIC